jgi:hypothetical protein
LCLLFSDVQPRGTESEKSFLCVFLLFSINWIMELLSGCRNYGK